MNGSSNLKSFTTVIEAVCTCTIYASHHTLHTHEIRAIYFTLLRIFEWRVWLSFSSIYVCNISIDRAFTLLTFASPPMHHTSVGMFRNRAKWFKDKPSCNGEQWNVKYNIRFNCFTFYCVHVSLSHLTKHGYKMEFWTLKNCPNNWLVRLFHWSS